MFGMMADEMLNEPELAAPRLTDAEKSQRLSQLTDLIEMVRPIIQQDGGDLVLLSADVTSGVVELQLQGACSSCAVSATTLQAGVERILKDRLDWVTEVSGGVDEDMDWEESASMGRGAYVPKWLCRPRAGNLRTRAPSGPPLPSSPRLWPAG
jgi:Fe-S cluster biogenesis protein NfuA